MLLTTNFPVKHLLGSEIRRKNIYNPEQAVPLILVTVQVDSHF